MIIVFNINIIEWLFEVNLKDHAPVLKDSIFGTTGGGALKTGTTVHILLYDDVTNDCVYC